MFARKPLSASSPSQETQFQKTLLQKVTTSRCGRSSISPPTKNWTNDPNGLVFYEGEYHLFFQHNPSGIDWGNMTWGHAVSTDLVHWQQLDHAILPGQAGHDLLRLGRGRLEQHRRLPDGRREAIVCIYTSAGGTSPESQGQPFTQCSPTATIAAGRGPSTHENPVLKHIAGDNRDPKVFWHEPTKRWVMALYLDGTTYALFGSPN